MLPAELTPAGQTIEYILPHAVAQPPVFLFVLDTAMLEEELEHVRPSVASYVHVV